MHSHPSLFVQRKTGAFSLIELLVTIVILALFVGVGFIELHPPSVVAKGRSCTEGMRTLQNAKFAWAADHPGTTSIPEKDSLSPYLKHGWPICPDGGTYGGITDMAAAVTCTRNGDRAFEPATPEADSGALTHNGCHDIGFGRQVAMLPPLPDDAPIPIWHPVQ